MCKISIRYTNRLFADGLELIIKEQPDCSVLSVAQHSIDNDPDEFIHQGSYLTILELDYPSGKDIEYINKVLVADPGALILLLTNMASNSLSLQLINSGISGYLLKLCGKNDLENAIHKILDGKDYFCSDITKRIISGDNNGKPVQSELSEREIEILRLLASNLSISAVANQLTISENTVKTHKKNILSKLGVQNTLGLFLYAIRHELVDAGDHDLCNHCPYFSSN